MSSTVRNTPFFHSADNNALYVNNKHHQTCYTAGGMVRKMTAGSGDT